MMAAATDRRAMLGLTAALPALAMVSTLAPSAVAAAQPSAFRAAEARYRAARARFEHLPDGLERSDPATYQRAENDMHDAWCAAERTDPASWAEFADCMEIALDDGEAVMGEDMQFKLLADARRLAGKAVRA